MVIDTTGNAPERINLESFIGDCDTWQKVGDVYFDALNNNTKRIRVIVKDGFFTTYTNDENKGIFEDKSFEWVKDLE